MAGNPFSHNQLTFVSRFAGDTGLDPGVCVAWVASEQFVGQSANNVGNQNWLSVGLNGNIQRSNSSLWNDVNSAADATTNWMKGTTIGGWGGGASAGRIILGSVGKSPQTQMSAIDNSGWVGQGVGYGGHLQSNYAQYAKYAPGATGTPFSTPSGQSSSAGAFTVGDSANPFEDYWSAINRLSQEVNWYTFTRVDSPNNVLFLADGTELLQQAPHATIHRRDPRVLYFEFHWDNTAFQYKSQHHKKKRTQSRSTVATITSPTEAILHIICNIVSFQPGDVVRFVGCGAGNGPWLVAEVRRSVFQSYSELILVPGILPVTQNAQHTKDITANVNATASSGGSGGGGGSGGTLNTAGETNPAPGATWGRLDMGFDGNYDMNKGAVAPYSGTVGYDGRGGWPGLGSYFWIKNDNQSGPDYTRAMYFAEGASPRVRNGQHVQAGQRIGDPVPYGGNGTPGNFEIGPAKLDNFDPLAKQYGLGSAGSRRMVLAFYNWMRSLGAGASNNTSNAGNA